jgi:hypothetical protein
MEKWDESSSHNGFKAGEDSADTNGKWASRACTAALNLAKRKTCSGRVQADGRGRGFGAPEGEAINA